MLTEEYLESLVIEGVEAHKDVSYGNWLNYRWAKIADDIDMHIKLSYNEVYNYYEVAINEFVRGYHAGHTQMETKVRYKSELEGILRVMNYKYTMKS